MAAYTVRHRVTLCNLIALRRIEMNASKEQATRALKALKQWKGSSASKTVVFQFIEAALRKLPTEAAFNREKERRAAKRT